MALKLAAHLHFALQNFTSLRCSFLSVMCSGHVMTNAVSSVKYSSQTSCTQNKMLNVKNSSQMSCNQEKKEFAIFYRFSYIRLARFLSRLKIYQTGLTVIAVPPAIYCYSVDLIGIESCIGATCLSSVAMILLYFIGNFFRRVVGLVALSTDEQLVRISRLTFWGNRRDIYVSPDDIVPLGEYEDNLGDAYVKMRLYSEPADVFYMFLRYGSIVDHVKFAKVFGSC